METFLDLCSGIGGGRLGLERVGLKCVGYSDTSRLSVTTYNHMFGADNEVNYGNIRKIKAEDLPMFDMLIAGFPCQSFSVIGRQAGFQDVRGQIIFDIARILKIRQPKCFLLENVKGLVTHDKGNSLKCILNLLEDSGYDVTYRVLSSLDFGVPQMRQRVYIVGFNHDLNLDVNNFTFPEPKERKPLWDFLVDNNIADNLRLEVLHYYLNNKTNKGIYSVDEIKSMEGKVIDTRMSDIRIYEGKVPTLRSQRDGILYVKNRVIHCLSGYEALLLQGFPIDYANKVKNVVSDRHLLKQAGNAMTVNVIEEIGKEIIKFLA